MYVCMHVYIYIYVSIHTYIYICICICVYVQNKMCMCILVCIHVSIGTNCAVSGVDGTICQVQDSSELMCTHACTQATPSTCVRVYIYIYVCVAYMQRYVCMYVRT